MAKKLAIVVGHMRRGKGAKAVEPIGQSEYDWNGDLARLMVAAAKAEYNANRFQAKVFTRDSGGVSGAYDRAKDWGAVAAVELHFNAASAAATGTETLYVTEPSRPFAQVVHAATLRALGLRDRGVKTPQAASGGRGHRNLVQMGDRPSILTEPFFGSNPSDATVAQNRKAELASAQVLAAAEYLLKPFDNLDDRVWVVDASALNVRGGPGVDYEKLSWGPLKRGDKVLLLRRRDPWFQIQAPNDPERVGFVHSDFLR